MSSKLRFSQRSPADFFMFNGKTGLFYTLECKSFAGSCSFERDKNDKGIIHYYQIESLSKFKKYTNVVSGFLLDFRKTNNTYFLDIDEFLTMINQIDKKSFNESEMLFYCSPLLIEKTKLKVNYRFNVENFLRESAKNV